MARIPEAELSGRIQANRHIYNSHFDFKYAKSLVDNLIDPIDSNFFQSRLIGFDEPEIRNNPDKPLIYASNHSGMAFPWDGMLFTGKILKRYDFEMKHSVRPLAAPVLSKSRLMNPFMIDNFWKKCGGIDATTLNFETMMEYKDSNVMIYPEGVPGIGKGFNKRYQLQRFSTSFIRMSLKHKTDIVPYATVNGEFINPHTYSIDWINKLSQKVGIPYIPIGPLTLMLLIQPWFFYSALPARLTYVKGKRIQPYKMLNKPFSEITEVEIKEVRDKVQAQMQQELDDAVVKFGKRPYSTQKFVSNSFKNITMLNYWAPPGWVVLFTEHDRLYRQRNGKPFTMKVKFLSGLSYFAKNPFTLTFFIPFLGLIPMIIRGYKGNTIHK